MSALGRNRTLRCLMVAEAWSTCPKLSVVGTRILRYDPYPPSFPAAYCWCRYIPIRHESGSCAAKYQTPAYRVISTEARDESLTNCDRVLANSVM